MSRHLVVNRNADRHAPACEHCRWHPAFGHIWWCPAVFPWHPLPKPDPNGPR